MASLLDILPSLKGGIPTALRQAQDLPESLSETGSLPGWQADDLADPSALLGKAHLLPYRRHLFWQWPWSAPDILRCPAIAPEAVAFGRRDVAAMTDEGGDLLKGIEGFHV